MKECINIFNLRLEKDNLLSQRLNINSSQYELISNRDEQNKIFGELNIYIRAFIDNLWNDPKSLALILSKAEKKDVKELASFIVNNFYENIFSSNIKEDQLIYI